MLALMHLELRRFVPMLPFIGLMLAVGMVPGMINPDNGVVGLSFVSMSVMLLIVRTFPIGPAEDRANTLVATLPISRRLVVSARYLLVTTLVLILSVVLIALVRLQPGEPFSERLAVASVFIVAPLLTMAVTGPLSSRGGFGAIGPALPMLIFAVMTFAVILLPESVQRASAEFVAQSPLLSLGAGCVTMAVLLLLSYLLSVRWFERRDL